MTTTSTFLPIDIGSGPNDGTGDNIRDAFNKINANFASLFTAVGSTGTYGITYTSLVDGPGSYSTGTSKVGTGPILVGVNNSGTLVQNWLVNGINGVTVTADPHVNVVSISGTGISGYNGSKGSIGYSGSVGRIGPLGYVGSIGYVGSSSGFTGSASTYRGFNGSQGATGYTGSTGVGYNGSKGDIGSIGYIGSLGNPGYFGSASTIGGYTGSGAGFTGSIGYTGSYGTIGAYASGTYYPTLSSGAGSLALVIDTANLTYNGGTLTAPTINASSDLRLKNVVGPISNALEKVNNINGVEFYWNDSAKSRGITVDSLQLGVIAQEIREIIPGVVSENSDGQLTVNYIQLVPLLIEAVKELSKKVNDLSGVN
jgi:hypothetical protein